MFIIIMINIAISCVCLYHTMAVREELALFEKRCTESRYNVNYDEPMNNDIDRII